MVDWLVGRRHIQGALMATNWKAMQVPVDKKSAKGGVYHPARDCSVKRMAMGSWRANQSKGGALRPR